MSFEAPQVGDTTLFESDFGDEMAASSPSGHLLAGLMGQSPLIVNGSQLADGQHTMNASMLEQVLKLSPGDLEFLGEPMGEMGATGHQIDLVNPLDLQQQQQQLQLQLALQQQPDSVLANQLAAYQANQAQQQQQARNKSSTARVPRGWSAYKRRLASIYYPMQQQLASMLSTASAQPSKGQPVANVAQSLAQQQQQQLAAAAVAALAQELAPTAAASTAAPGFSLASLVPKPPKIMMDGLSKANLSKKLNKLRIKSGRKIEPNQQQQSAQTSIFGSASNAHPKQQQQQQQMRPPTPDNEFNYDIFNNQLAQLERQQRQLQALESMAAAAAAAAAAANPHQIGQSASSIASPSTSGDDLSGLMNLLEQNQVSNLQHQETLQQLQSSPGHHLLESPPAPRPLLQASLIQQQQQQRRPLDLMHHLRLASNNSSYWPPDGDQQQQAVFVTRLPADQQLLQQHFASLQATRQSPTAIKRNPPPPDTQDA